MQSGLRHHDSFLPPPEAEPVEPTVAAVIAAYNEQDCVAAAIESLLAQSRPPDSIFVVVNNSTDQTFGIARRYNGSVELERGSASFSCTVTVIDIGINEDRKPGALSFAWSLVKRHDYILGVDADTILDTDCLRDLLAEMTTEDRLGGVSAVCSFDQDAVSNARERRLVRAQRFDFAASALRKLALSHEATVLGGQCSLLRSSALHQVTARFDRPAPWVTDSPVEDAQLTVDLLRLGHAARVSVSARATTGPMLTTGSLRAQQSKWAAGDIRLLLDLPLWCRLQRAARMHTGLITHLFSRVLLVLLLAGSVTTDSLPLSWWWLVPPIVAVAVNVRIMLSMTRSGVADVLYALAFFPHELHRTARSVNHAMAWLQVLRRAERDHWVAQASAEWHTRERGFSGPPLSRATVALSLAGLAGAGIAWVSLSADAQHALLFAGWAVFAVLLGLQTLSGIGFLLRAPRVRTD